MGSEKKTQRVKHRKGDLCPCARIAPLSYACPCKKALSYLVALRSNSSIKQNSKQN